MTYAVKIIPVVLCFLFATIAGADEISFSRDIRPILSENCFTCHGPDEKAREAGLRLHLEADTKGDGEVSGPVVPGKADESTLIERIESTEADVVMPPPQMHKAISPQQVALLKQWINEGAPWGNHWSYEPVRRPTVPTVGEPNAIDAFLADRLANEKLSLSKEAEKATLIRRLALDLTGLPPSLEELASLSMLPHEQIVARFIDKPAYGEHWGQIWLDLARYADSAGYPSDPGREIWAYRDWVIRALNSNMPFDQFTIEQIAGDLLPNPTDDQLIATAFHRNTMTNNEGGTNDEEFRSAAVIDRVNTTFAVWMGTTMACAQCHTHKYDPITINEYFQLYAFFNQTADADKRDESPLHELLTPEMRQQREAWSREKTNLEARFASLESEWLVGFDDWLNSDPMIDGKQFKAVKAALDKPEEERDAKQLKTLQNHFSRFISPATEELRVELSKLERQLADSKPVTVPIMLDLDAEKRRKTQVQLRGNWQSLGDEVSEDVPAAWHALPEDAPRNRLSLAQWIVSRENPLTARVTVNRMWESIFGVGIVRSSEEFGSQGDAPVHPELLDWLAAELMDSGWDTKHLLTLIFNSRAYRQDSASTSELNERDPDNRLLARGPRFRPSGEMLRDQALSVSGLLSDKMFGTPVRPQRPNLGLSVAFGGKGGGDWETSKGDDRHRRSIYTEVRRNSPYPSFTTFDAPNREVCTIRRGRSNTPLQAFVTLNDPVFVETHQALARRILSEGGDDTASRIQYAYRVCLAREPDAKDLATLTAMFDKALAFYQTEPELAMKMATDPVVVTAKEEDLPTLAAWTAVAGIVMNLDEFLMRR